MRKLRWVRWLCLGLACLWLAPATAQQVLPPVGPPGGIACAYNSSLPTITTGFAAWVQCDSAGRLLTTGSATVAAPANVTLTDCSGTITTGGTAQAAFTAQTTLHGFTLANIDSTAEPLWFSFTGTATAATAASYPLAAPAATTFAGLASFTAPYGLGTNHALSVVAATTGHKFSCTWW